MSSASKCAPCSGLDESAKMSVDEAKMELASLGNASSTWMLKESEAGVLSLSRKFTARNFQAAIDAINDIGAVAENANHHPDLHLTNYRDVEIEIYTHKVNGLTRNDFILMKKINSEVTIKLKKGCS
jgi:4a-hydroxytetrahydrobiopterin dehydratase